MAVPVLVAIAASLVTTPASADHEPGRLGLTPIGEGGAFFELTLDPGEARQLEVEAANFGHEELVARTYAADVYTIVNGGFGADLFGEPASGTTLWLDYPTQEVALRPDQAIVVDFEVAVPAGTPPGEYVTALVIENAEPIRGSGTIAVDQVNRSAIAVAIEVPGARDPALEIGDASHRDVAGASVVTVEIHNRGNVHLRPAGELVLRDAGGTEVMATAVAMDSVYAGTSTALEAAAPVRLAEGEYCAELILRDEETGASDASGCLGVTVVAPAGGPEVPGLPTVGEVVQAVGGPLPGALLLVAIVAAATLALVWVVRRGRAERAVEPPTPSWPPSDLVARSEDPESVVARVVRSMRLALREYPQVRRAWIVERDAAYVLAVEGPPGTTPADASRLSTELQEHADRATGLIMPLQVVCLQGAGLVDRMTADAVPFYVSDLEP